MHERAAPMTLHGPGRVLLLTACLAVGACRALHLPDLFGSDEARADVTQDIQNDLMAFADSYVGVMAQAFDQVSASDPAHRAQLLQAKLRITQAAISIAADQNPVGALLDMTVMVTIQNLEFQEKWLPEVPGESVVPLVTASQLLEPEIWLLADRVLDDAQLEALRALIPEIRERYVGQLATSIRASDFAGERHAAVARLEGGTSLLTLFQLDPLAGLSPAAQELAQSRLLAERAFFWAKHVPTIMNWQAESVLLNSLDEPQTQRLVDATAQLGQSSQTLSAVASDLAERLPEARAETMEQMRALIDQERTAALEQLAALTTAEREAALKQAFDGIASEREALLRTFENEDVRLRGLLEDLRGTIDASTALSTSLTTTVDSTQQLLASMASDKPAAEQRPFDIDDYKATAVAMTTTVEELNRLITSLGDLLESPAWDDRNTQLTSAADQAKTSLEALIDRGYRRGLMLIGVLVVGFFLAALVYKTIATRLIVPRGPAS